MSRPTALIADDEPRLREALTRKLGQAWPELEIVAQARNGREAIEFFEERQPQICFLDVQMPGLSGVEAARVIGRRAHLVFVTAYDKYAVQAFAQGVLDYLVKPVEPVRLAETVTRLKEHLASTQPTADTDALLRQLAEQMQRKTAPARLGWLRAQTGQTVHVIAVDDIDYLRSDTKYTRIAWRRASGEPAEALVSATLRELLAQLDPEQFAQVHRSIVVNLRAISHVVRADNGTASIHLRGRSEVLPISRSCMYLFDAM